MKRWWAHKAPQMTHLWKKEKEKEEFQKFLQHVLIRTQNSKCESYQVKCKKQFGLSHQTEHLVSHTSINDTVVQPQAEGRRLFCQVSQHWGQLFHICSREHKIKQTLGRARCLLFHHVTRKETKTIGGQRQAGWLARAPGVSRAHTHTKTQTG